MVEEEEEQQQRRLETAVDLTGKSRSCINTKQNKKQTLTNKNENVFSYFLFVVVVACGENRKCQKL